MSDRESMFTDAETLTWIRNKIAVCTGLEVHRNSDLYGAMHILAAGWQAEQRYIRAYKCDDKQGLIANLAKDLMRAVQALETLGGNCMPFRETLAKVARSTRTL